MKIGKSFERLSFFMLMLFLLSHMVGCLWIFLARTVQDDDPLEIDSWIKQGKF